MNKPAEIFVIAEGPTEQKFVKELLAPHMAGQGVYLTAIILHKPGQKGGDVKFARVRNDIERQLKQRSDTFLTLFIDYYGIKSDWPDESKLQLTHTRKAEVINSATAKEVERLFPERDRLRRFIPYVSMHEIEALYFSDPARIASELGVRQSSVDAILAECGEPESINDHSATAPSKRLERLNERFKKTSTGINIAKAIGIPKMRSACPLFNKWLEQLEKLPG